MSYLDPSRTHAGDPVWMKLCREVINEAKKVKELGGGKIRFVAFAEKSEEEEE